MRVIVSSNPAPRYPAIQWLLREESMAGMLDGKVALVTGGGGGIGRATALAMVREGARVAVADFAAAAARDTVAQINAQGGQAITLMGDVTRSEDVRSMVQDTITAYGRLDCAFNNAGIAGFQVNAAGKKTAEWSEESFDRMIAVNLKGVWLCMKEEIPQMLSQGGGAIVNTASIAGLIGLQTSSAYVAAKHGVIGLTKTAALEYGAAKASSRRSRSAGWASRARSPRWWCGSCRSAPATSPAAPIMSMAAGWRCEPPFLSLSPTGGEGRVRGQLA